MSEGLGEFGRIRRFFAPLAGPGGLDLRDDAAARSLSEVEEYAERVALPADLSHR